MGKNGVVVIGAGPAGLTAAYKLARSGVRSLIFEKTDQVGGISRTETYNGYRFDIGGHRFFTKVGEVEALWHEIMGDEFLEVDRLSRIYYDGQFYDYPLDLWNTVGNLGPIESVKILASYLRTKLDPPYDEEENFEQWVTNRFGVRLYRMFFKTYTEKVWGISCDQIRADWAAQRIKGLSLKEAVWDALFDSDETSLINRFHYPRRGPGQMWERCRDRVEQMHGTVQMNSEVVRLRHSRGRIQDITVREDGRHREVKGAHYINSMPISQLIHRLKPAPPSHVIHAAEELNYRDFLIVALIIDAPDLFPDNWIYVHSPNVEVGRVQNFKNWSPEMVPDSSMTCLGMEYFCNEGDGLWTSSKERLLGLAERELRQIQLAGGADIVDGTVVRQPYTYPVYDSTYKEHLNTIKAYLDRLDNLQTVGRAGMHRYNNQDHSMLTGMLAARNYLGEDHDIWNVNVERSYHEDFTVDEQDQKESVMHAREEARSRQKVGVET